MTEWIEINKPWLVEIPLETSPFPKHVDVLADSKFNVAVVEKTFREKWKVDFADVIGEASNAIGTIFVGNNLEEYCDNADKEQEIRDAKLKELSLSSNGLAEALVVRDLYREYSAFINSHPDVVEWIRKYDEALENRAAKVAEFSFQDSEYCRPGVLIEVEVNGVTKEYILGNINLYGSMYSGDEHAFDLYKSIVRRAKVLI